MVGLITIILNTEPDSAALSGGCVGRGKVQSRPPLLASEAFLSLPPLLAC